MNNISLKKWNHDIYEILKDEDVVLGHLIKGISGEIRFLPYGVGTWDVETLKDIIKEMNSLSKKINDEVCNV